MTEVVYGWWYWDDGGVICNEVLVVLAVLPIVRYWRCY